MARTDAIVLGAGVGASIALHLAKRGLSVALSTAAAPARRRPTAIRRHRRQHDVAAAFPRIAALMRVAFKRRARPTIISRSCQGAPWLLAFRANTRPAARRDGAAEPADVLAAVAEHEA